ncbi:MAG: metalloregulator ArsR/SmtB family transcription factor [Gammaproteobacteria bacterium]|nr:metalloregulator ArsR/SmtB family transcription factor [Gammaproteobacteria bacterium]
MTQTVHLFKALANENRLRILKALTGGECSVGDLARRIGRSQPVVSQHLARLRHAGLVTLRRQPPSIYYALAPGERNRILLRLLAETDEPSKTAAGKIIA